ncbi:MAG: DUF2806 domain-containing protein [Alphaproteobacteria bacterium]|jgi:hypothetical protein
MSDGGSLINIAELAKPASLLIEKISEAIGGAMRPRQIRRVAEAEADAAVILAKADIEISALQRRALGRFLLEEGVRQANIEKVTELAIRELEDDADPSKVDNDWIASFFEKARLVSDEDMQVLWSKLLAGEANSLGCSPSAAYRPLRRSIRRTRRRSVDSVHSYGCWADQLHLCAAISGILTCPMASVLTNYCTSIRLDY